MTAQENPYVRVYHALRDTVEIYDNDRKLAAYLRLLVAADMAWPSAPEVPRGVRPPDLRSFEASGHIEVAGRRYRVRELDDERGTRSDHAAKAAKARWDSQKDAAGNARGNARERAQVMPLRSAPLHSSPVTPPRSTPPRPNDDEQRSETRHVKDLTNGLEPAGTTLAEMGVPRPPSDGAT